MAVIGPILAVAKWITAIAGPIPQAVAEPIPAVAKRITAVAEPIPQAIAEPIPAVDGAQPSRSGS